MSELIEKLQRAQKRAMEGRPNVGGFPYLAEVLRQAGVKKNAWALPSCQSLYVMAEGSVAMQMPPLVSGMVEVPRFDREALIRALRTDQSGKSTFPEFLRTSWEAGVVGYEVDFAARTVRYYGASGEEYLEEYPSVAV